MPATSNYAIPYPAGSDPVDVPADLAAIATLLDGNPYWDSGSFASRPTSTPGSPGIAGRKYYATDTGVEYLDIGTGWVKTAGTVQTADIADNAITQAKMADDSVGAAEIIDAAVLPAHLGQGWAAKVVRTTSQSLNNNITNTITWTAETFDSDSMVNLGANADRITITHSGLYIVGGNYEITNALAVGLTKYSTIENNGTGGVGLITDVVAGSHNSSMGYVCNLMGIAFCVAGSYLQLRVAGDGSGGSLTVGNAEFWAARLAGS